MLGLVEVRGRVLADGRVAAADVPAGQAQPQVHPAGAVAQALLAAARACWRGMTRGASSQVLAVAGPRVGGDQLVVDAARRRPRPGRAATPRGRSRSARRAAPRRRRRRCRGPRGSSCARPRASAAAAGGRSAAGGSSSDCERPSCSQIWLRAPHRALAQLLDDLGRVVVGLDLVEDGEAGAGGAVDEAGRLQRVLGGVRAGQAQPAHQPRQRQPLDQQRAGHDGERGQREQRRAAGCRPAAGRRRRG